MQAEHWRRGRLQDPDRRDRQCG